MHIPQDERVLYVIMAFIVMFFIVLGGLSLLTSELFEKDVEKKMKERRQILSMVFTPCSVCVGLAFVAFFTCRLCQFLNIQ